MKRATVLRVLPTSHMARGLSAALAAALLLLANGGGARAWGYDGHRIIADIAEDHLTPTAQMTVRALLALDQPRPHRSLGEIASWADYVRADDPVEGHEAWHFVNIPIDNFGRGAYEARRDCLGGDCIVEALRLETAVLATRAAPAAVRLQALLWVTHLAGDISQPLHVSNRGDLGGLRLQIADYCQIVPDCPGKPAWRNLHHLWDDGLVLADMAIWRAYNLTSGRPDADVMAKLLESRISPADIVTWSTASDPEYWANDTIARAATVAYGRLPQRTGLTGSAELGAAYVAATIPAMEEQLKIAGIRLASLLNRALDSSR